MKRRMGLVLAGTLAFSLALSGCGGSKGDGTGSESSAVQAGTGETTGASQA